MNRLLLKWLKSLVLVACLIANALFVAPVRAATDCTQTNCYFMPLISRPRPPAEVVSSGRGCSNIKGNVTMRVSGKILNTSDKPLSDVAILVKFFDITGEVASVTTGMSSWFVNSGEYALFDAGLNLGKTQESGHTRCRTADAAGCPIC